MDFLSTDLHFEILLRVPATTLVTSARQVCRLWRSIISHPTFVDNHYKRSVDDEDNTHLLFHSNGWRPNRGLLMYSSVGELTPLGPNNRILPESPAMCHPTALVCKGLVLYICRKQKILEFFLCNPILNQTVSLPPIEPPMFRCSCRIPMAPREVHVCCKCSAGFCSDRYRNWGFGFGFDQITKEYKVVVISKSTRVYCCTVDVVPEKKTISPWKISEPFKGHFVRVKSIKGVFVNGRLHWLYSDNTRPYPSSNTDDRILSINLHTEKFTFFSCPSDNWRPSYLESKRLGVLGGTKLCVYVSDDHCGGGVGVVESSVCVMEDYGNVNSWTEYRQFKNLSFDYGNFCYWRSGRFVFHHQMNRYFVVDDETNEVVDSIDHTKTQSHHSFVSTFVPSLLSLLSGVNPQDQKEEEEEGV